MLKAVDVRFSSIRVQSIFFGIGPVDVGSHPVPTMVCDWTAVPLDGGAWLVTLGWWRLVGWVWMSGLAALVPFCFRASLLVVLLHIHYIDLTGIIMRAAKCCICVVGFTCQGSISFHSKLINEQIYLQYFHRLLE